MNRVWGVFAVFLLLPLSALAQSAEKDEREKDMQEMRARIEKLEKLVALLQKEKETNNGVATAPAAGETVEAAATPNSHEPAAAGPVTSMDHSGGQGQADRKSTRLNSSHSQISYAVFCLKTKRQ